MPQPITFPRGVRYADSEEPLEPITIRLIRKAGEYCYSLAGPANLSHGCAGQFNIPGDRSECEAAVHALQSLTTGRLWHVRTQHVQKDEDSDGLSRDAPRPKIPVTIQTNSTTLVQIGACLHTHNRARIRTNGGPLDPAMKLLRTQMKRFDVRWELIT